MSPGCSERLVPTPLGPARVLLAPAAGRGRATLVLGHGAGGGAGARDLVALARALPADGVGVVRVEQPWRVAGRRVAAPPPVLDRGWLAVLGELERAGDLAEVVVVGGRSAGARVACRTAAALGAAGVVALAFPLEPPGRPGRSRRPELRAVEVPLLVVQGSRDAFGGPDALAPRGPDERWSVVGVPGADHTFAVRRADGAGSGAAALETVVDAVRRWLPVLGPTPPG